MNDSVSENGSAAHENPDIDPQWRELRELLVGPEHHQLADLLARLNDPVRRAEEFSQVLPDAITLSRIRDDRVTRALGPSIDTALKASVRKDPKSFADAIFPALGPAIRKSISATLMGMIQSLNELLNQSFSIQGMRWRLEAMRTRRPFAEVVLLHSLVYRVEQIFLIHRNTGIVLRHVASADALGQDPDMVSGMLTAIQDFVKDAFHSEDSEILDTLRMGGDHSVWIEQGPEAFLAAVLRGTPPMSLRERFRNLLAEIHETFQAKWDGFDGQVDSFAMIQPQLESALSAEVRQAKQRLSPLLLVTIAAVIGIVLMYSWQFHEKRQQWRDFLALLHAQSGIVVTTARQEWGRFHIEGLRDPFARDPQQFAADAGLDPQKVDSSWKPYQSLEPPIVLRRVQWLLQPPAGVTLRLRHGVLTAAGQASHDWVTRLRHLAPTIAGVDALDDHQVKDIQLEALQALAAKLSRQSIGFEVGSTVLGTDQQSRMVAVSSLISEMHGLRRQFGIPVRVVIIGQSDPTGPELLNMEISQGRSLRVMRFLLDKGMDPTMLNAVGKGSAIPFGSATPLRRFDTERKVTFRTFIDDKETGL